MRDPGLTITNPAKGSNTDIAWNGSTGMFAVAGTDFKDQTVKLQHSIGGTFVDVGSDASFTANGAVLFTSASNTLRVNVSGSGDPALVAVVEVKPVADNKAY